MPLAKLLDFEPLGILFGLGASDVDLDPIWFHWQAWKHKNIEWRVGDITNLNDVIEASKGADCIWHLAAAVGPFHPNDLYDKINYHGTLNIIEACKVNGIKKLVMSTSPSTRMDGSDLDGVQAEDLPELPTDFKSDNEWFRKYKDAIRRW